MPIVCVDERVRQYAGAFREYFSRPQYRHFVTMLVALLLFQGPRTLTNLFRTIAGAGSVASLSRFLAEAPWDASAMATRWCRCFCEQVAPEVAVLHAEQRAARPRRRGRPRATRVTGYLIGDDSTMHKRRGKTMEGLGKHSSTTERRVLNGHSLVQALYVVAGRRCPLAPQLYRQQAVCAAEGVAFASKVDLMAERIRGFAPAAETHTHVLLDSWYRAQAIWRAARARDFAISCGLTANRLMRINDPEAKNGWRWQDLTTYAGKLSDADDQQVVWPQQEGPGRRVWVHSITTTVRNPGRCQVILVRDSLSAPVKEVRFWASSDLDADAATLISHLAVRWDIKIGYATARIDAVLINDGSWPTLVVAFDDGANPVAMETDEFGHLADGRAAAEEPQGVPTASRFRVVTGAVALFQLLRAQVRLQGDFRVACHAHYHTRFDITLDLDGYRRFSPWRSAHVSAHGNS